MAVHELHGPLGDTDVARLALGDEVYLSGPAFTCRSRLQRAVFDEGRPLPFDPARRNVLVHVGPIVVREAGQWRLVAFTPTSSIRFEKWGPRSVETWKLKAIVGKTTMGPATARAMKACRCVHLTPPYVAPNLLLDAVRIRDVVWLEELGSIEACWQIELDRLGPFLVDIDAEGRNYFDALDTVIDANRRRAYAQLGIPPDFEFTRLY